MSKIMNSETRLLECQSIVARRQQQTSPSLSPPSGIPGDFVAQITWRPDCEPFFYDQRCRRNQETAERVLKSSVAVGRSLVEGLGKHSHAATFREEIKSPLQQDKKPIGKSN